ncbi:hypothetical protein [uncultured Imperialibacter sp.]|uniref:hypothetical protein n=1 Tax=uncultured Imperialibacter sp. TaxID=1672639 RepID=UPI0030DC554D|tara:strand:+ start:439 stop:1068 length:630 start_codon:yes stop_codon:yes gene_type:complete
MKWTYSIRNKTTAAALLLTVFLIVLFNNLKERKNSVKISETIHSIFQDRLVVESYIFQHAEHLHKIEGVIDSENTEHADKQQQVAAVFSQIMELNESYLKTVLTEEEERVFGGFNNLCQKIGAKAEQGDLAAAKALAKEAALSLKTLSSIQVTEGASLMTDAKAMFSASTLSSQLESAILLVIALIIQALIFASNSLKVNRHPQNPILN